MEPHHTTARELIDFLEGQLASAGKKDLPVSFAEGPDGDDVVLSVYLSDDAKKIWIDIGPLYDDEAEE